MTCCGERDITSTYLLTNRHYSCCRLANQYVTKWVEFHIQLNTDQVISTVYSDNYAILTSIWLYYDTATVAALASHLVNHIQSVPANQ